jgi:hypothetical protein
MPKRANVQMDAGRQLTTLIPKVTMSCGMQMADEQMTQTTPKFAPIAIKTFILRIRQQ